MDYKVHMNSNKSQPDKFKQAARDLETDNDEKRFDENLKKLAKSEKPKDPVKQD